MVVYRQQPLQFSARPFSIGCPRFIELPCCILPLMAAKPVEPVIALSAPTIQAREAHLESTKTTRPPPPSTSQETENQSHHDALLTFVTMPYLAQIRTCTFKEFLSRSVQLNLIFFCLFAKPLRSPGNPRPCCFSKLSFRLKSTWFGQLNSPSLNGDSFQGRHIGDPGHHRLWLGACRRFSALGTDCSLLQAPARAVGSARIGPSRR